MIRILVDTGADYLPSEMKEQQIEFVPLQIAFGETNYFDGKDLFRDDFYRMLTAGNIFPKTSQPTVSAFLEIFEDVRQKKDEMICILISSSLSGTYQNALLAKELSGYEGIYLVDSLSASSAIRFLADRACALRLQERSAPEIVKDLEALRNRLTIFFLVDTLEYLYRGGRLSKTEAALGKIAKIKPLLRLDRAGKVSVVEKCFGLTRAFQSVTRQIQACPADSAFPFYSLWSYGTENCEELEARLKSAGISADRRLQVGAAIGTHIGPRAAGVVYVSAEKAETENR